MPRRSSDRDRRNLLAALRELLVRTLSEIVVRDLKSGRAEHPPRGFGRGQRGRRSLRRRL